MGYIRNNVEYRILSSDCLSQFKRSQSFIFNELINGKYKFSETAKELLLIEYDLWFKWLLFTERYFLKYNVISQNNIERLVKESSRLQEKILAVLKDHPDIFSSDFLDIWVEVHPYSYKLFEDRFADIIDSTINDGLVSITTNLIKYLNYTLFELHEVDSLLYHNKDQPFLNVDKICPLHTNKDNCHQYDCCDLVVKRAKIYKSFNFRLQTVILKNHDIEDIPDRLLQDLKRENIEVVGVM